MKDVRPTDWGALPLVLSASEVARIAGLCLPLVYELFNRSDFPTIRLSKRRLAVGRDQFKAWLGKQTGMTV